MVLEQSLDGETSHRAVDLPFVDGFDPVVQFALFNSPVDPETAQVLWEADDEPIQWNRLAEVPSYRFVEHAILPADGRIEYRVYSYRFGYELGALRHSRDADDPDYAVDASLLDALPVGAYEVHAHLIVGDRPVQTMEQRLDIVGFADDQDDQVRERDRMSLEPGNGWDGPLQEPGPVGDADHPGYGLSAIARWAVIPHQVFDGEFAIGVAAFHSYGIDRVEFSVDGGPWVPAQEMMLNPRTQAEEYYVYLDAGRFRDGKVTVRAIAYPEHGQPRLLGDMELFANAGQSMAFPVIELGAGTHHLRDLDQQTPKGDGWLTVRPKPGVAKEDCVIVEVDRLVGAGNLKIQGLTMAHDGGNDFLYGKETGEGRVWLDDVKVVGNGRENPTSWLVHLWGQQFYTNCDISRVRNVFHGGGGLLFARHVRIHDTYEDVFRSFGYAAYVTVDGIDRGDTENHPDVFEFSDRWVQRQVIFHHVTVREAQGQGVFGGNMQDIAMVDCDVETPGWNVMQLSKDLTNVLFQDSRFQGGARFRDDAAPNGVMIRNSLIGWRDPFLPEGWQQPGVWVEDHKAGGER